MSIQNLTLKELVTERPDLIQAVKSGEDEGKTTTSVEKDKDEKITKWIEEKRDIDGILISSRIDDYTYYQTGEVNEISLKMYDKDGRLEKEEIVKHKDPLEEEGKKESKEK